MRVVQLIDSLEAGGAERMAVNIANGLSKMISFSGLVATRNEGTLKDTIDKKVNYFFLTKKNTFDILSLLKFRHYLSKNKISIIHAHGSSYFFALLVKIIYPKIKIFWHDHNGNRVHLDKTNWILKLASFSFDTILTVNEELKHWSEQNLKCKYVYFIPNFAVINPREKKQTYLKGETGKRIVCLANLRYPKNHMILLESFLNSKAIALGWTLHLIGTDKKDTYSNKIKNFIANNNLKNNIFLYGSCEDISTILAQSNIGVLVSTYEGFPVTLLEYGMANLAVITSNVGYCERIIQHDETGLLFNPIDEMKLSENINSLLTDEKQRAKLSSNFNNFVLSNYSETIVIQNIIQTYTQRI